jgi:hypothetical protein
LSAHEFGTVPFCAPHATVKNTKARDTEEAPFLL